MKNIEIERKWLMSGFPQQKHISEICQVQGYISFEPSTVRIRKTTQKSQKTSESYVLTIKGKGSLCRTEVEFEIEQQQYTALLAMLAAPTAQKKLRTYALPSGHILECSLVDEGQENAFYYAEVEFESEKDANDFIAPAYFGREVTYEMGFSMAEWCKKKHP